MQQKPNISTRLASMLIDHFVMCFVCAVIVMPFMLMDFMKNENGTAALSHSAPSTITLFFFSLGFALYYSKDTINGRSIAKRLMKLQVIHNTTGEVATPLRCLIRNLFIPFWMIEILVTLIKPERRLGDIVAGTRVVPFNPDIHKPAPMKYMQVALTFLLAFVISSALLYGMTLFINDMIAPPVSGE